MADTTIQVGGKGSAPFDYKLADSLEIIPRSIRADFDGTGAGSAFAPCLVLLDPNGNEVGRYTSSTQVAAGGSATVTWFPFVGGGGTPITQGTGVPPAGNLDGYIFAKSNVTVTGTSHTSRSDLLIQGNPVVLDGATSIKIEFWCALCGIVSGVLNQAGEVELWDNFSSANVDKGTIGIVESANTDTTGAPIYGTVSLTPAAGTHTYALYGYKNVAGSTVTFFGNTFVDGTGNIAPMWYRITVIAFDPTLPT